MNIKAIWAVTKETFQEWNEDKAPRLAAALSYYTIFSLAPLLVLIIAITGFVIGNNAAIRHDLLNQVQGMVGNEGAKALDTLITNTSKPREGILASVLGVITLLLGATGVFGQLQDALNTIWEVEPKKGGGIITMIKNRFLSFTMVLGVCFLLLVSLVISTALSVVNTYFTSLLGGLGIVASILNFVVAIGVVTLIFALIFKVLPDVKIAWGDVWMGALVTAILFGIGRSLISLYLSSGAASSAYGAAGSLVVILLWVYYSAQILFMGAEFTQVYAKRQGSRLAPSPHARPLTQTERAHQGIPSQTVPANTIQPAMIPVAGQPMFTTGPAAAQPDSMAPVSRREKIRYTPPNPNTVIPVIGAGVLAGAYTLQKIIRRLIP